MPKTGGASCVIWTVPKFKRFVPGICTGTVYCKRFYQNCLAWFCVVPCVGCDVSAFRGEPEFIAFKTASHNTLLTLHILSKLVYLYTHVYLHSEHMAEQGTIWCRPVPGETFGCNETRRIWNRPLLEKEVTTDNLKTINRQLWIAGCQPWLLLLSITSMME